MLSWSFKFVFIGFEYSHLRERTLKGKWTTQQRFPHWFTLYIFHHLSQNPVLQWLETSVMTSMTSLLWNSFAFMSIRWWKHELFDKSVTLIFVANIKMGFVGWIQLWCFGHGRQSIWLSSVASVPSEHNSGCAGSLHANPIRQSSGSLKVDFVQLRPGSHSVHDDEFGDAYLPVPHSFIMPFKQWCPALQFSQCSRAPSIT